MKDIIIRRVVNFLKTEKSVKLKFYGIFVLVVLMLIQTHVIGRQKKQLVKLRNEKKIAKSLPEIEKKVDSKKLEELAPEEQIAVIQSILEGTSYRFGVYQAIINGEVYSTGNKIGDYAITKITMEAITLENKDRNEVQKLFFPEEKYPVPEE